jgi:hypothetical protein
MALASGLGETQSSLRQGADDGRTLRHPAVWVGQGWALLRVQLRARPHGAQRRRRFCPRVTLRALPTPLSPRSTRSTQSSRGGGNS